MKKLLSFLFSIIICFCFSDDIQQLYDDLKLIETIDKDLKKDLPLIYNNIMLGGYINMPSARMNPAGTIGVSFADNPPYFIYNLNFQPFSFIELSGNYRVFVGQKESNFGNMGFGDDADRTANVKFGIQPPLYGYHYLPDIAIGFEDFYGSRRFYAPFLVITEEIPDIGLELTLGYGKGRLKNVFGGLAWSPWRPKQLPFLKDVTFLVEYDGINYKHHPHEHAAGRSVRSRINAGVALTLRNVIQLKVSSLRGEEVAAMGSLYYNFGYTNGLFPKKDDPPLYSAPQNFEPIGPLRQEKELAKELAFALNKQGFHLVSSYLGYSQKDEKTLWLKIINMTYWRNADVKERLEFLLSHLMPSNIDKVIVVIEENGVNIEGYVYESAYLQKFKDGKIGKPELEVLSPQIESPALPSKYEASCIYYQRKSPWTITMRPRILTFFGSVKGKLKYTLGWVLNPDGYLLDSVYYNVQAAYNALSSLSDVGDKDQYNPSQLLNVRTDAVNYYKTQTVSLEHAYLQKGWNMGCGFFSRLACGYFEVAYAGLAGEVLYYPIKSNLA
ncbi:MAG: YjbH domain-containing protein, partial [Chlamydiales bacterium]|nr:YjbH domain-containing protein [Chlamydiales bacterium]